MSGELETLIRHLEAMGRNAGLGEVPAGVVVLYPGEGYLQVLIGEHQGEDREQLRSALRQAADEL